MPDDLTQFLRNWNLREQGASPEAQAVVYAELLRRARRLLRAERANHTLRSCDLVNEAWLRVAGYAEADWQSRAHFFAIGARMMRQILVDHARARQRAKRGGGIDLVTLTGALDKAVATPSEVLVLHDALERLARLDERQAQVVELRFFGGLTVEETAEVLQVSNVTVKRDWVTARAWLIRELATET